MRIPPLPLKRRGFHRTIFYDTRLCGAIVPEDGDDDSVQRLGCREAGAVLSAGASAGGVGAGMGGFPHGGGDDRNVPAVRQGACDDVVYTGLACLFNVLTGYESIDGSLGRLTGQGQRQGARHAISEFDRDGI